jgi:hypothetical protein
VLHAPLKARTVLRTDRNGFPNGEYQTDTTRKSGKLRKSLICRYSLKNLVKSFDCDFFGEQDFDSMGIDLSGKNFAKTIAKDWGNATTRIGANLTDTANKPNLSAGWWS